jgi:hypothetical protein
VDFASTRPPFRGFLSITDENLIQILQDLWNGSATVESESDAACVRVGEREERWYGDPYGKAEFCSTWLSEYEESEGRDIVEIYQAEAQ